MSGVWVLVPRRMSGLWVLHFEFLDVGASWGLMFRILGSNISEEAGFPVIGIGDLVTPPKLDFGGLVSEFLVSWGQSLFRFLEFGVRALGASGCLMFGILGSHISDDAAFLLIGIWELGFRQNLYCGCLVFGFWYLGGFQVLDFELGVFGASCISVFDNLKS